MRGRARTAALVGLIVVLAPIVGSTAGAFHAEAPTVYEDTQQGAASWGMVMDQGERGDIEIDVVGERPVESSRLTVGTVFFDENGDWQLIGAFTFMLSPDRQVIRPAPATGSDVDPMMTQGDTSVLEDVTYEIQVDDGAETASHCPGWFCASITLEDYAPGEHEFITWMAGLGTTNVAVSGHGLDDVEVNHGDALSVGDAELPAGAANAQAQQTVCDSRTDAPECPTAPGLGASYDVKTGVKAIANVDVPFEASDRAWGFWQITDVKLACQFTVGLCAFSPALGIVPGCAEALGLAGSQNCARADVAWQGPGDLGEDGATVLHPIEGTPAGEYTFTVDHMVDVWGPRIYEPETSSFVFAGEHFTTLTLADVQVPAR